MAEIYQLPDNGGNANAGGIPFSIPIGNNGGLFGNGNNYRRARNSRGRYM